MESVSRRGSMSDWRSIEIAGVACQVFEPAVPHPHGYTVIFLDDGLTRHGAADDVTVVGTALQSHGLRAICPSSYGSWWADRTCHDFPARMTPEQFVVDHVCEAIGQRWGVATPQIALLGHRMGGQGGLRIAYKFPDRFPIVAAIAPAIDFNHAFEAGDRLLRAMYADVEDARQDTATLHIHPLNWPRHQWFCCDPRDRNWFDSADRLKMKLSSLGVPFESDLETTADNDSVKYFHALLPVAVEFVLERLERERLRA